MGDLSLSICMPTRNFGKFIGLALESITKQLTDDVEIVIVDGASTDNTAEVVRGFQERFKGMRYYRLEQRGGIDRDMAKTVELARGKYCWLFSSDDVMREGVLRSVLNEINSGCDAYLCGLTLCALDMKPIMEHRVLNIASDAEFDLGNKQDRLRYFSLAETTTAFFSFMGSLIVKKSKWDAIPFDESFDGSLWAHVARLFRMMGGGMRLKYLAGSYLLKRGDNDSFLDRGLVYRYKLAIDGFYRLAETFFGKDSEEAFHIRRVVRNEFPSVRVLLNLKLKARGSGNAEDEQVLDELAAKVYRDGGLSNHTHLLMYKATPLSVFKVAKAAYKAIKPYIIVSLPYRAER